MKLRGISYAVDHDTDVRRDLEVIRDELHCTGVLLYGAHIGRLRVAAASRANSASRSGSSRGWPTSRSARSSSTWRWPPAAEAVRAEHGGVTFVAGCEHSLFTNGLIPGPHTLIRLKLLRFMPRLQPRVTRKLDALLEQATTRARREFHGPITYAAAFWEQVDWSRFDVVGVNLYRFAGNAATYTQQLRALHRGKPVVITEFGCGAHAGADRSGPAGFLIVQWFRSTPRIYPATSRREVQATYLGAARGLRGRGHPRRVRFTFAMPDFLHRPDDPEHDLDMAGFGVVLVAGDRLGAQSRGLRAGRRYAIQGESSSSSPSSERPYGRDLTDVDPHVVAFGQRLGDRFAQRCEITGASTAPKSVSCVRASAGSRRMSGPAQCVRSERPCSCAQQRTREPGSCGD